MRQKRLNALGYKLVRNYACPIRRRRVPYATKPLHTGSTNVFENLAQVDRYIAQVEQVRSWQQ